MPPGSIDHLTITAPTLAAGAAFVRKALGVAPQAGGAHPRMGTHNLLLRLGDTMFVEVIAPDPAAPTPARARWFALDTLGPDAAPALSAWVVRTPDIHASAAASPEALGPVEPMRRGALDWLITIPADGALPLDGIAPALIQWPQGAHPAAGLEQHGLSLVMLELFHPEPARITRLLRAIGLQGPLCVSPLNGARAPYLLAHINTPQGLCLL